jgi:oxygen-independent coproporphyrinogen-3 oxidase
LKINRVNQNNEIVGNALELLKDLNVSIDLINGLPDVDYINELNSLDSCLKKYSNLNHISFYDLTIDEKSYFSIHEDEFSFPEEDRKYFFADGIEALLKSNNFVKYEISNWSRNNKVSYHNLAYWNYENYLGIGAAAHSKIENLRIENIPDIATYIDNFQHSREAYLLTEKESLEEMLLMGFRTIYGIPRETLKVYSGSVKNFEKLISFLRDKDILDVRDDYRVVLNEKGRLFLDSILVDLFGLLDSF